MVVKKIKLVADKESALLSAREGTMRRRHRVARVLSAAIVVAAAFTLAPVSTQAATAHRTSLSLVTCLSWSYSSGDPWECHRWYSQRTTLLVRGTQVSKADGAAWRALPYVYSSKTHKATYDYRLDSTLRRPAYSERGSKASYSFFDAFSSSKGTKTPNVLWPACTIHWTLDFHGAAGTKLVRATEVARWRKVLAKIADEVGSVKFVQDADSIYKASASNPGFTDQRIHITYSSVSGAYHSAQASEPLGYGGLRWIVWGGDKKATVQYGYVIINARDASNMLRWPSPSAPSGVSEMSTLYTHEVGHALGLRHTTDKYQVMYPQIQPRLPNRLGSGDIAGLEELFKASACTSTD